MIYEIISDCFYKDILYPASTFVVNVTYYFVQEPQNIWDASSDWEAQGYTELEWEIESVTICNEDGSYSELTSDEDLANIFFNETDIDKQVLESIEKEKGNECIY